MCPHFTAATADSQSPTHAPQPHQVARTLVEEAKERAAEMMSEAILSALFPAKNVKDIRLTMRISLAPEPSSRAHNSKEKAKATAQQKRRSSVASTDSHMDDMVRA